MATLIPREPYTPEELASLYPQGLQLQLVQVFFRHGERTPSASRLPKTGLHPYWPYCGVARRMVQVASSSQDLSTWDGFQWRRKIETIGSNDEAVSTRGPGGETENICLPAELTDKGRERSYALGKRLRHLYVDQLGFMPRIKSDSEDMYLRSSAVPRALESLHQVFWGMYPSSARTLDFPAPEIVTRHVSQETIYPNEYTCTRFRELTDLFADRAAARWDDSEKMAYVNTLWSKYMPDKSPKVAVDSHPSLFGIMDTINATDAHGPATKLPSEFYDKKARAIVDRIAVEQWFAGFNESSEYRRLGIGALMGDVVERMVSTAVEGGWRSKTTALGSGNPEVGRAIKFAMNGCHDDSLASILSSIGGFQDESWPPFSSSIAIELFSQAARPVSPAGTMLEEFPNPPVIDKKPGVLSKLFGKSASSQPIPSKNARAPLSSFSGASRESLQSHYVRIRYNDRPVTIPGCAAKPENHLPGDKTFCTLDAFKAIVDKFTPSDWKAECMQNLGAGLYGPADSAKSTPDS